MKFTVIYKFIGKIEEHSFTKRCDLAELEEYLRKCGEKGQISYYLYGREGTARENMFLMAFI